MKKSKVDMHQTKPQTSLSKKIILDAALSLAENQPWEEIRLYQVADYLNSNLVELLPFIKDKEDIVDLLSDRCDYFMLSECDIEGFNEQPFAKQFEQCVMAWLTPLYTHQTVVKQMLFNRLEPGHLHIQLPMLFRISRTVQWIRELCKRNESFIKRATEETVLTTLFIATIANWLNDNSEAAIATRHQLQQRIEQAIAFEKLWPTFLTFSADN